jgi:hypothetical protein
MNEGIPMVKTPEFGFDCGDFDVALTAEKIIVPGSKGTLKKSLLPTIPLNDAAGIYKLTVCHNGATVYRSKVHVLWVEHPKEPEPFLGFKCDQPDELANSLRAYKGKAVELKFDLIGDGKRWRA